MSLLTTMEIPLDAFARLFELDTLASKVIFFLALIAVVLMINAILLLPHLKAHLRTVNWLSTYPKFFYASFLKPHATDDAHHGQQSALESFYNTQADVYDASRKLLLRGREDMLALVAAQLKYKEKTKQTGGEQKDRRPVWIDIGGGTGYNIEAMQAFLDVPTFFSKIYLVDLSPSLLKIASQRFARLGWNVHLVCEDARSFRLPQLAASADLVTMSYSLSMIPDYYCVVDCIPSLLASDGLVGVVDFYVQSIVDISGRNYTGGTFNRHVTWLSRVFWRAWFDIDRVGLEGARRDYLEYRFGTCKSVDERNYLLGGIPYYIFLGTQQTLPSVQTTSTGSTECFLESIDASCTESPYLSPMRQQSDMHNPVDSSIPLELRSKAYSCALINLSSNLPLPSMFYQNNHRRIHYDDQLKKHTQFNNEYIYAFTWEDPREDHRLLKIRSDDAVLCVTSAGDNVLDYILQANPRRVHAVDLNPNQNHLLELKIAALQTLQYAQVWKMFGEGRIPNFRNILLDQLSPHLSSQACQFWVQHAHVFSSSHGLYETGGSRHAIKMIRRLFRLLNLTQVVHKFCNAKTLNEQREMWPRIRNVLLSRPLHWALISTEWFAWKAAGVPPPQRRMILEDHNSTRDHSSEPRGEAIWEYIVDTLDPVVRDTLIGDDNYFYLLCLQGRYTQRCHPHYLSPRAHAKLARPTAFDGLRIHTDEIEEVITRMAPSSLDHAIIMDSMDWFPPPVPTTTTTTTTTINASSSSSSSSHHHHQQPRALNRVLKLGGKVLLRSAARSPWYITHFETAGFVVRCVSRREGGRCVDRVNMYASTWVCRKVRDLLPDGAGAGGKVKEGMMTVMSPLDLGAGAGADGDGV